MIFGAPTYKAGQRLLLFLTTSPEGTLRVAHSSKGNLMCWKMPQAVTYASRVTMIGRLFSCWQRKKR